MLKAVAASRTDIGIDRDSNEDDALCDPDLGLYLVADGTSGFGGGKLAAELAARTIVNALHGTTARRDARPTQLSNAIAEANLAVLHKAREQWPLYQGLATTLALVLLDGDRAHVAHVGLDRVYRLRDGVLELLTSDHSLLNEVMARKPNATKEELAAVPRGVILRALGVEESVTPGIQCCDLRVGDVFCLCTDGLYACLEEEEIRRTLSDHAGELERAAEMLITSAKERGCEMLRRTDDAPTDAEPFSARDNITVVLLRIDPE